MEGQPNVVALIVATIMPMLIGFIYYHPKVVGGPWMRANGFTREGMKPPKPLLYLGALALSFLLASWIQHNVTAPDQVEAADGHSYVTFQHGVAHGLFISIMLVLPVLGTMGIFEQRGWRWLLVNFGYWIITICVMAGILSAWR